MRDIPSEALLPGMLLDVRAGESFPADGVVMHGRSSVNAALLTGESRPASVGIGQAVFAGTLNVEAPVRVLVQQAGETSRMQGIPQSQWTAQQPQQPQQQVPDVRPCSAETPSS